MRYNYALVGHREHPPSDLDCDNPDLNEGYR
jgi:hypothetical protein